MSAFDPLSEQVGRIYWAFGRNDERGREVQAIAKRVRAMEAHCEQMRVALMAAERMLCQGGVVPIRGETWKQVRDALASDTESTKETS